MIHQARAVGVGELGQQHQPIALGQQEEDAGDDTRHRAQRQQLLDDRALARRRDRRVRKDPLQRLVAGNECRRPRPARRSICSRSIRSAWRDVEQRAGVAARRQRLRGHRHCLDVCANAHGSRSGRSIASEPTAYVADKRQVIPRRAFSGPAVEGRDRLASLADATHAHGTRTAGKRQLVELALTLASDPDERAEPGLDRPRR